MINDNTENDPDKISNFLNTIWREAHGDLKKCLQNDIQSYTAENIAKAEGLLLKIKEEIKTKKNNVTDLSNEFYKCIPHIQGMDIKIKTLSDVSEKASLCQVMYNLPVFVIRLKLCMKYSLL